MRQTIILRKRHFYQNESDDSIHYDSNQNKIFLKGGHHRFFKHISLKKNTIFFDKTTIELFEKHIKKNIDTSLTNYHNISFLTFGQTGSGKTFTLVGNKHTSENNHEFGLIQLTIQYLLKKNNIKNFEMSSVEIYNNIVYDNLHPLKTKLIIRELGDKLVYKVSPVIYTIYKIERFHNLLTLLLNNKTHIGKTELNNDSSRSHIIYKFKFNLKNNKHFLISFVDLAGMERMKFAPKILTPQHKIECCHINKSLFALKECIRAIKKKQPFIPYRRSKLTLLLKDFFKSTNLICIATLNPFIDCIPDIFDTIKYIEDLTYLKMTIHIKKSILKESNQQNNIPTNQQNIPSKQRNIPSKQRNIPSNQRNNISSNQQNNIPTNQQNNIPTNQRNTIELLNDKTFHDIIIKHYEKYIFKFNSLIRNDYKHFQRYKKIDKTKFIDYIIKLITHKIIFLNQQKIYFQQLYQNYYEINS